MVRSLASKQNGEFTLEFVNMDFTEIYSHFKNFWIILFKGKKKGIGFVFWPFLVVNNIFLLWK